MFVSIVLLWWDSAESVDDEDEILEIVCEQMANFVPLVGGGAFAFSLLPVFEAIASGEEVALRQLAIKGLTALIPQMPAEHVRTYVFDVVRRLAKGHWYAQRSSVCGLLHVVYPGLDAAGQAEVLGVVGVLSTDAAAMVRRSLAENLVHLIPLVAPAAVKTHLHPVFLQLTKDDQDSVRMLAAALCVPMAKAVAPDEIAAAVIPAFQACAADAAWRVRYNIAVHFADLQIAVGPALTNTALFPAFVVLLGDSEAEVRTAISLKLLMFSRNLSDDVRVAKTLSDVVPKIQTLVVDESQHVRSAVASVIMGLAMLLYVASPLHPTLSHPSIHPSIHFSFLFFSSFSILSFSFRSVLVSLLLMVGFCSFDDAVVGWQRQGQHNYLPASNVFDFVERRVLRSPS